MAQGFFVTSSGTNIGKTYVTCALIKGLRQRAMTVDAIKPVLSGFDPLAIETCDTALLANTLGLSFSPQLLDKMTPWRFRAPLSPDMAAAREGRTIQLREVIDFCRRAASTTEMQTLLAEGAGGVLAPLNETETNRDVIVALGWPTILVGGSYLGSISHTLTAYEALLGRAPIAAIVLSESADNPVALTETASTVQRFVTTTPVLTMSRHGDAPQALLSLLT
jgi:dethiobiotin synthetase